MKFTTPILLGIVIIATLPTTAGASRENARGFERAFTGAHSVGTMCENLFTDHPALTDTENMVVSSSFVADGSYYGNQLFHNRNEMAAGNRLHECDATVVAYNSLPLGTILRITNRSNDLVTWTVIQDRGGPLVTHRPDLSRGTFESLIEGDVDARDVGVHQNLLFEVMVSQ